MAVIAFEPARSGTREPLIVDADVNPREWEAFVASHPESTAYHRWHWRALLEREFRQETLYLAVRQHGPVVGVLPLVCFRSWVFGRFFVSLPFVNYGGVLARTPEAAQALVDRASDEARRRGASHVELRHTRRQFAQLPGREHKVAMTLRLAGDEESAWRALDGKVRNQVRKAQKAGLRVETGDASLAGPFYDVFAANMRDLGVPVHSRRFFADVLATVPQARAYVVRHLGRPVAAGITIGHRDVMENPWASSLASSRALCANMLLYWTMIRDAIARSYRVFDFGRSTPGGGTYRFKKQWGAEAQPLPWEYVLHAGGVLPDHTTANPKFAAAVALWRRLPVPVTRLLGPSIVRAIP